MLRYANNHEITTTRPLKNYCLLLLKIYEDKIKWDCRTKPEN